MKTKCCSSSTIGNRVRGVLLLAISLLVHSPVKSLAETVVEQWVQRYNGPANNTDQAAALVVDFGGSVVVTGHFVGSGSGPDYYTAKYAAADGALLWERRYNGPGNGTDQATALAVDGAGNVIVTGVSAGTGSIGSDDYCTAKYAAADGLLLREKPHGAYSVKFASAVDADHDGLLDPRELGHFGTTAGHSAHDDADKDGRVELLEMAFGGDPLESDAGTTPSAVAEDGYLTITITKHPGVRYEVQSAGDLAGSSFSAATTAVLIDNSGTFKVRDNVAIGSADRRFLRVLVPAAP